MVADPDPLARQVIAAMLRDSDRFTVVAQAADRTEALELTLHHRPDILLTELSPGFDGVELVGQVAAGAPEVRVVALTATADEELALVALRRGASGVLSKANAPGAIVQALLAVQAGEMAISRTLTSRLVRQLRAIPEPGHGMRPVRSPLTSREWEVLDLLSAGASTREIAEALVLTDDTVYGHVKNVLRKLGVTSRAAAVDAARTMLSLAA